MIKYLLIGFSSVLLVACGENGGGTASAQPQEPATVATERNTDFAQVSRGGNLYQKNCAECHGANGQGDPNWRQRDAEGLFPAPPLNGTGHAWHHPQKMLHHVIKNGSPGGQGKMPAWGDKLSDQQIEDTIAWFKSKWPQPVYEAWYQMNEKKKGG
ncbi:MAG: cytochrome c [Pseudomonadota bacterium]